MNSIESDILASPYYRILSEPELDFNRLSGPQLKNRLASDPCILFTF